MTWYCMRCGDECEVVSLDNGEIESICCGAEVDDSLDDFDPDIDAFSTFWQHDGTFAEND